MSDKTTEQPKDRPQPATWIDGEEQGQGEQQQGQQPAQPKPAEQPKPQEPKKAG